MKATGLVFKSRDYIGSAPPPTVLEDESRFGNDGVYTDITDVQLPSGLWVRSFNATTSKITIPAHASFENIFDHNGMIAAWINPASDGESNVGTIMTTGFDTDTKGWVFKVEMEVSGFVMLGLLHRFSTSSAAWREATANVPINSWSFVAFTYDNSNEANEPIFYLNGAVEAHDHNGASGTRVSDAGVDLVIGASGDTRTFDGMIGLEKVWNYRPSLARMGAIYQAERHWFGV